MIPKKKTKVPLALTEARRLNEESKKISKKTGKYVKTVFVSTPQGINILNRLEIFDNNIRMLNKLMMSGKIDDGESYTDVMKKSAELVKELGYLTNKSSRIIKKVKNKELPTI